MAKSVLKYVQRCLSVMDSDKVDSISDTEESSQIAEQLEEVYYELLARQDWPFLHKPLVLDGAGDVASPTSYTIPEAVKLIEQLSYNVSESGGYIKRDLEYVDPMCFIERCQADEDSSDHLLVQLGNKVRFYVALNRWPSFWTSFDDTTVVMDAVHQTYDSTLTTAKLDGHGIVIPTFSVADAYEPGIPQNMEPLLQAELNRQCFRYFKQVESVTDEQKAKRQLARGRREAGKSDRPADRYYRNRFGR